MNASLQGVTMFVSSTAAQRVVSAETRTRFQQRGSRVVGEYSGGRVWRGRLVGTVRGEQLTFRYAQVEASGEIHAGRFRCDILRGTDGRLRSIEHFRWTTREGTGTNVFDEGP